MPLQPPIPLALHVSKCPTLGITVFLLIRSQALTYARVITLAMTADERAPRDVLARMLASTVQLVIQLQFDPQSMRRRVESIFEVTGLEGDTIRRPRALDPGRWPAARAGHPATLSGAH